MLILSVESTAVTASAALWQDGKLIGQFSLNSKNTHSTTLLPMAEHLLRAAGYTVGEIDLFACAAGPGSFTGIRIGTATVKGLAFGSGKPCIGVSSLAAMAYGLRGMKGILCPAISARRDRYYTALFRSDGIRITRLTEDDVILTDDLGTLLAKYNEPIFLTGDGYEELSSRLMHLPLSPTPEFLRWPGAFAVAECAADVYLSSPDPSVFTADALKPVYLRKTQAEREREKQIADSVKQ